MTTPIKHLANFVSTVFQPARVLTDVVINPNNESAARVNSVRSEIEQATAAYARRNYPAAIAHYKTAQGLCYQLLNPGHRFDHFVALDRLVHPVGMDIELGLASAGLKLIQGMQPDVVPPTPPVRVTVDLPVLDSLANAGFVLKAAGALDQVTLGTTLLTKGRADEAADVLSAAVTLMADDQHDVGLKATAMLNLSVAQLARGDAEGAARTATQAAGVFRDAGDQLGEAQALQATGVAQARFGQDAESGQSLAQATELFKAATGADQTAPEPGPAQPANPGGPIVAGPFRAPLGPILRRRGLDALRAGGGPQLEFANAVAVAAMADAVHNVGVVDTPSREIAATALPTTDVAALQFIDGADTSRISVRWPGGETTFAGLEVDRLDTPVALAHDWQVGIPVGPDVAPIQWQAEQRPATASLIDAVYRPRIAAAKIESLIWWFDSEATTAAYLSHVYSYVIPVGLGDCYHHAGNFDRAEEYYLQAAGYTYLNPALEAPGLWIKLAVNALEQGDAGYRREDVDSAKAAYSKVVRSDGTADPQAALYNLAAFAATAAEATTVLGDPGAAPDTVNPAVVQVMLTILARWEYLNAGLDFYGLTFTPVFTFEYLQNAARAFAQQSIQAEREYINFQAQAEAEAATRRDLENSLSLAGLEAAAQDQLAAAAASDAQAAAAAVNLAQLRVANAKEDRDAYRDAGYWQYISQSIATAHGAHEDWYEGEIRDLARQMEQGSWSGDHGKLAAAATLLGGQKSYEYQLGRMQNQIEEMQATLPIAEAQRNAALGRQRAAQWQALAAHRRVDMVSDAIAAFDNEVFTPELWTRMALLVRDISRSYQQWAIAAAKLMERAYNFENDTLLQVIRPEYGVPSTGDLLGSDLLMRDVESFTYHELAHVTKKVSNLKDVVSLRNEFPFQFRGFMRTGTMTFETSLHDFARLHPGFYGQRLAGVEVQVVGLLPPEGVRGTLRGGLVSRYSLADGTEKQRVHSLDTAALSEYTLRGDSYVYRADLRQLGLFEGHGVATTWQLDLPRGSNNLDYRLITDVQLVLYYTARYSDDLRDAIVATPPQPGEDVHVRDFAVRYDFPEAWYELLRSKSVAWTLDPTYLPRNEQGFTLKSLAVSLVAPDGTPVDGVDVTVTVPGQAAVTRTTDANGGVAAESGNDLADVMGGALIGEWRLAIEPPIGSPLLRPDGSLDPAVLRNMTLIAEYQFAYRV